MGANRGNRIARDVAGRVRYGRGLFGAPGAHDGADFRAATRLRGERGRVTQ